MLWVAAVVAVVVAAAAVDAALVVYAVAEDAADDQDDADVPYSIYGHCSSSTRMRLPMSESLTGYALEVVTDCEVW